MRGGPDCRRLLGNPRAPDVLAQLQRLGEMGIAVHGQVVIVPGMNDGEAMRQTIADVWALWPTVRTLALVPVGLTRHCRPAQHPLRPQPLLRTPVGEPPLTAGSLRDERL